MTIYFRRLKIFFLRRSEIRFEKRIFLIIVMIMAIFLIFNKNQAGIATHQSPLDKNIEYLAAKNKIRGDRSWHPRGLGSIQDISTMPEITAGAVADLENGEVLWSKNLKMRIAPASLSKLATLMVAVDISTLDNIISVSENASGQIPTTLGLETGEKLTLNEAIAASVLTSANDATEAIAESLGLIIGKGTDDYMALVNEKLSRIGAYDSYFETATGLDSTYHYSTVYDLLLIAGEVKMNYPQITNYASLDSYKLEATENHKIYDLPNWNALLGTYPGVDGLKTGYTEKAGHSTMVTASRNDKELIAVIIGAQSFEERDIAAAVLLNLGFNKYGINEFPINNLNLVKRYNDWRKQLSFTG